MREALDITPRVKRVIFLFMAGGPSQMDLFDPKDYIRDKHGKAIDSPLDPNVTQVGTEKFLALGAMAPVQPRGQSGMMISDLMPHLASISDDICLLRGMSADNPQHAGATSQFHTGSFTEVRPSMGAWISYGLGTENQNLAEFRDHSSERVSHLRFRIFCRLCIKVRRSPFRWTARLLPSTTFAMRQPAKRAAEANGYDSAVEPSTRRRIARRREHGRHDSKHGTGVSNADDTPQLVDMSNESEDTLKTVRRRVARTRTRTREPVCWLVSSANPACDLYKSQWMAGIIMATFAAIFPRLCNQTDQPVAALVKDLKQRGMLEDTLVLWSGEFGRTPWSQDLSGTAPIDKHGREHQPQSFCAWMAGGGIKPGLTYGETDHMGYQVIDGKVHLHDLHATMLSLLGLDHTRLTRRHLGRDFRLTDVYGSVVKEILS